MNDKMDPSKGFKPIDVEMEEIIEEILEGGLSITKFNAIYYFVFYIESEDAQDGVAIDGF